MTLTPVLRMIEDIAQYSGRKDKEKLIERYSQDQDFRNVVYYAINPFQQFNTKVIEFNRYSNNYDVNEIFKYLDYLSTKRGANDDEISELSRLASIDEGTFEVVYRIINKDLKCGANLKTFKNYIPGLIDHEVMACERDLDYFIRLCNNDFSRIVWSIKLDGVRCTTVGNGVYLSRNGKEFPNFQVFDDEIKQLKEKLSELDKNLNWDDIAIDGEVITTNSKFQDLMTQLRRIKDADSSQFRFCIFDITIPNYTFIERYTLLQNAFLHLPKLSKLDLLNHYICSDFNSVEEIKNFANQKVDEGFEGLVLKEINSPYENKRSRYWCKVKKVYTADVEVLKWNYGTGKNSNCIGDFTCRFSDGTTFDVGSGLTDHQRVEFMKDTPKVIEIEYQELMKDGKPRFGVFKRVRDDKNEID